VTGAYPVLHVGSFGSVNPASPVQPAPPWTRTFRGAPESVPQARRFVAELLLGCPARETLMTCVSELSANAIAHTDSGNGGVFIVTVDLPRPGVARIAVTDEGSTSLPAAAPIDLMAEGGRGLALVAALTARWGHADAHPGRTVWAESSWPIPTATPAPAAETTPAPGTPASSTSAPGTPASSTSAPGTPAAGNRAKTSRRSPSGRPRRRFPRSFLLPPGNRPPSPAA
jgi:anti-sigma regulatory factor (Ser/Thr protein kinase)